MIQKWSGMIFLPPDHLLQDVAVGLFLSINSISFRMFYR